MIIIEMCFTFSIQLSSTLLKHDATHSFKFDTDGYFPCLSLYRQQDVSLSTSLSVSSIATGASLTEVKKASVASMMEQRRDRGGSPPARRRNTTFHRPNQRSFRASSRSSHDLGDTETIPFTFPHRQQASLIPTSLSEGFIAVERGRGIGRACGGATQR